MNRGLCSDLDDCATVDNVVEYVLLVVGLCAFFSWISTVYVVYQRGHQSGVEYGYTLGYDDGAMESAVAAGAFEPGGVFEGMDL